MKLDKINQAVVEKFVQRAKQGMDKYKVGMDREDKDTLFFLKEAQQEALDFAVYLERIIQDMEYREAKVPLDEAFKRMGFSI